MRVILRLSVIYLLIGVVMLNVNPVASDEETPLIPVTVLLDESLYDNDTAQEILSAWLVYGLARVVWVREHFTQEYLETHAYRRSFNEEFYARETLVQTWEEFKAENHQLKDPYLDILLNVYKANFLREYVWVYLRDDEWKTQPERLQFAEFLEWQTMNLTGHQPETLARIEVNPGQDSSDKN